jgi:hypothetical protein
MVYGLIGFSGRQDRNEDMLALLDSVAPAYGEDWWFLGAHGFARTEALGWKAGAPLIERSLELAPRNAHAAHAFAHVLYERGDDESGVEFVARWLPAYSRAAPLHCHLSWHRALFELGRGRLDGALAVYEASVRPALPLRAVLTLVDSASLSGAGSWRARRDGPTWARWHSTRACRSASGISFADLLRGGAGRLAGDTEGRRAGSGCSARAWAGPGPGGPGGTGGGRGDGRVRPGPLRGRRPRPRAGGGTARAGGRQPGAA